MASEEKKPLAAIIVAKMKKPEHDSALHDEKDESPEEEGGEGKMAAAEEIMQAIKDEDAHALMEALESFCDMHAMTRDEKY